MACALSLEASGHALDWSSTCSHACAFCSLRMPPDPDPDESRLWKVESPLKTRLSHLVGHVKTELEGRSKEQPRLSIIVVTTNDE